MKILHLHDSPRIRGGATRYLRLLLDRLQELGHENALFCLDEAPGWAPRERAWRYPWARSALRRRLDFHAFHRPLARELRSWIDRIRPDLVHLQNWTPFRATVTPVLASSGLPVVMTVHDFGLLDPNPFGLDRSGPTGPIRRWLDRVSLASSRRRLMEMVDVFLCPSQALLDALPFPPGKARLLRLPVPAFDPRPAPPGPLRLLFAGSLYRSKGLDLLLEALAAGPSEATLEVAGEGDQLQDLFQTSRTLGLAERVRFLGRLGRERMQEAFRRCHLVVLPSRVPENSPFVLLEGGALGRPGAATHLGGAPEILAPPDRGWTFPPEDPGALAEVLGAAAADPASCAERGAALNAWIRQNCDPAAHFDAVLATYRELLA